MNASTAKYRELRRDYYITNRQVIHTVFIPLDKELIHVRAEENEMGFCHTMHTSVQLKFYELFISGMFHLILLIAAD